jgi:hypothetical protein
MYWMRSSCSAGTLSTPSLFHCSSMFERSIPSLSTMSLRSGSYVPISLGVISVSPSASYMGVGVSLVSPSIGVALPPCPISFLGLSVSSFVAYSLASLSFVFSFQPSSSLLVLSRPSTLFLAFGFLLVGVLLCFLLALFLWFGFINPSSSCCSLVFSTSCFLLIGDSLIRCPCS